MKKFLTKTLSFFLLLIIILVIQVIFRIILVNKFSWKLPNNINTVFLGASHIERGINDSIYPNSINLAKASERYLFTYLKLEKILTSNSHVKNIFLQFAPTDIWENTDSKYFSSNEICYFFPKYFPYFKKQEWKLYLTKMDIKLLFTLLAQKSLKDILSAPENNFLKTPKKDFPILQKYQITTKSS